MTEHYRHKKHRKRRYGGGRKPHLLAIEDKLLFILFYYLPLRALAHLHTAHMQASLITQEV